MKNVFSDYEPYVVVSSDVARYDSRFVGFGWNKVNFIKKNIVIE